MNGQPSVTDYSLELIISGCTKLQKLELKFCRNVSISILIYEILAKIKIIINLDFLEFSEFSDTYNG